MAADVGRTDGCVLALDLGTTAFKAAPVTEHDVLGPVTVVPYALHRGPGGAVTCDPQVYVRCAMRALSGAANTARAAGARVRAVGLSSQAQTFVPVDEAGAPCSDAVVWTDAGAVAEADEAANALPGFAAECGFARPSPLQFLPKLMRLRGRSQARRYLLLNEWVAYNLTGRAFGDTGNQGMGGFLDIRSGRWNRNALALAGITAGHLAPTAPAAEQCASLTRAACRRLGLDEAVPVYSCGNDQSCAAVGAGATGAGAVFANFGTAMVVYAMHEKPAAPAGETQIAGIAPLASNWFLLGVESECGNVLEWLARLLYPRGGVGVMLERALRGAPPALPRIALPGNGALDVTGLRIGSGPEALVRGAAEHFASRFGDLLEGVTRGVTPRRVLVGGGLSRSAAWLDLLSRRFGLELAPTPCEHPGLVGVARVIACAHSHDTPADRP